MDPLFAWKDAFLTEIDSVDRQHQRLIELINDLAATVLEPQRSGAASIGAARDALLDYTRVHFIDEETMMEAAGLHPRYVQAHKAQHQSFIDEVRALDTSGSEDSLQAGLRYLMGWLAHHILGIDQGMARQLRAVQDGASPEQALEAERRNRRRTTDPLLDALSVMLHVISQRNSELRAANLELEQRVRERTAELERSNAQLQLLAVHDELTGLPNRRFALSALQELWGEAQRQQSPLAVLMIDADHFKPVNDTYGHAEGDAVLCGLANALKRAVRTSDVVCRLGGDEFLVICPRSDIEGARQVGAKLLSAVQPHRNAAGQVCWPGAISLGAAQLQVSMRQPEDLLEAADQALYRAKHAGGGRLV
jgi:hemerythrin